jgi:hypothetical protein
MAVCLYRDHALNDQRQRGCNKVDAQKPYRHSVGGKRHCACCSGVLHDHFSSRRPTETVCSGPIRPVWRTIHSAMQQACARRTHTTSEILWAFLARSLQARRLTAPASLCVRVVPSRAGFLHPLGNKSPLPQFNPFPKMPLRRGGVLLTKATAPIAGRAKRQSS